MNLKHQPRKQVKPKVLHRKKQLVYSLSNHLEMQKQLERQLLIKKIIQQMRKELIER